MSAVFSDYIVQYSLNILQRLGSYQIHYEPVLDSTYHTVNIIYCVHMKEWLGATTTVPEHCIL